MYEDPARRPPTLPVGDQPLPSAQRAGIERAFGADFGDVRVHEGNEAASMGALAFTQGDSLGLGGRSGGDPLIGHEAAHVIQQRAGLYRGQYD
ncbi:MAG: DUF4157 domain-containing protein [Kofleriaceae bacterium]